jgi:aminoglycoside phosphotransferase (APT) family kinase protein
LEKMIKATQALPRKMTQAALDRLAQLSDGDVVCNGDFHPDNVVLSRRGPVIIDWSDATRGNPLADVARTSLLFQLANLPPHTPGRGLIEVGRAIFHRLYLRRYFQLQSASRDELRAWQLPVAVARLSEGLAEEETRLLLMIAGSFTDH